MQFSHFLLFHFFMTSVKFIKPQGIKSTVNAWVSQKTLLLWYWWSHSRGHLHYVEFWEQKQRLCSYEVLIKMWRLWGGGAKKCKRLCWEMSRLILVPVNSAKVSFLMSTWLEVDLENKSLALDHFQVWNTG